MRISVIIPALNEEACIRETLEAVAALQPYETIVSDGGSTDGTAAIAREFCQVLSAGRGRGLQQKTAADAAKGDALWFLHADTLPRAGSLEAIEQALSDEKTAGGNFSLLFDGEKRSARQLTLMYPWFRLLGLCYGDSGIFVRRSVYHAVGGFQPYPLFEDVDLVRRIKKAGKFRTLPEKLVTSSRRFEHRNFGMMFAEWTMLQTLYWAGVSPHRLARMYRPVRRQVRRSAE